MVYIYIVWNKTPAQRDSTRKTGIDVILRGEGRIFYTEKPMQYTG